MSTDDISVRLFFKEVVAEAKRPSAERGTENGGVLHSCSIQSAWFGPRGAWAFLTDTYIDTAPLQELKLKLTLFIVSCYRQR